MNNLRCIVSIICFFLFAASAANAQRNVSRILDYYESGAYHLTIKKIKDLKAKRQSKPNIQLVLADCYWQIGNKKRSTAIYEKVAVANQIPIDFKEKYERAIFEKQLFTTLILHSTRFEGLETLSTFPKIKGDLATSFSTRKKTFPKLALSSQKIVLKQLPIKTKAIKTLVSKLPNVENANPVLADAAEIKRVNAKRPPAKSLVSSATAKAMGKYRIRIAVATDEEASALAQYLGMSEVEIFEWANRKVVIAGYFDSPKVAQSFIDQYIKHFYDKAVVVTKAEGRYKSVTQTL